MSQRALVTGAAGFTGQHLTKLLVSRGWEVHGTVRSTPSGVEGVHERSVRLDDWETLAALCRDVRPDVVFHLAAVVDTVETPDLGALFRSNVEGTAALLAAVQAGGTTERVVVASSAFAYGRVAEQPGSIAETVPLRPVTPYGASKAAAEAIALQWWRQTGIDLIISRGFQHTGPGHVGAYALADWARQLADGVDVLEVGNLDVVRDYLDVRDAASALLAVALEGKPGEAYNVASGVPRTMRSLLDGLLAAFASDAEVRPTDLRMRSVDQPVFVANVSKLRGQTEWTPQHTIGDTLRDLAATSRESAATRNVTK
ncbi:NAD-dependent epimerase/dehydratase family protein [Pedococcus bigeumensis]|uniref:NAD-dependent epimerase/dehydratase family protein n=1 Tax=Pedococcus bigeumensis TaxID=433644 RepID=UPI002FE801A6